MSKIVKLAILIIGCELVGLAATPFTIASITNWYAFLNKPFFSPPNFVFGPVWTLLYFLMGVSLFILLEKNNKKKFLKPALLFFVSQLALNFLWSILFFCFRSPLLGLIDIVALIFLILLTYKKFYSINHTAAYLLIPYLLWVCFATALNFSILILN